MTDWSQHSDSAAADEGTELTGQVAVVTGSSSGIGRAIALELARGGADIVVHGHQNKSGAEGVARQVRNLGRRAEVILADLSRADRQQQLTNAAWEWATSRSTEADAAPQGVSIWVNNAGVDVLTGPAAESSFEDKLTRLWQVDVQATIGLSRLAGRRMQQAAAHDARQHGCIVNMGWDQALSGMAGDSGEMFAAVKGAVMAFSKSLAHSLAPEVRVNCLAPGWIKTAWGDHASAYWDRRAASEALLQRWGSPEDVARVTRFLVSPAASFMTGQIIPINGGFRGSSGEPQ